MSRYQLGTLVLRASSALIAAGPKDTSEMPGNGRDAFLRAAVGHIHAVGVERHVYPGQRGDGVGQEHGAVIVGQLADVFERRAGPGGGLRVHDGDDLGSLALERGFHLLRGNGTAPFHIHPHHVASQAFRDVAHAGAKQTIHPDDHLVARLDQVDEGGLHPPAAGGGHRQGHRIVRAEEGPEQLLGLVHDLEEVGIQIADRGSGHGPENPRRHVARPGAHEEPLGRIDVFKILDIDCQSSPLD